MTASAAGINMSKNALYILMAYCSAVSSKPIHDFTYGPDSLEPLADQVVVVPCLVRILATEDVRNNKETLGTISNDPWPLYSRQGSELLGGRMDLWATDGLLSVMKFLIPAGGASSDKLVIVNSKLVRSYVLATGGDSGTMAVVAMRVKLSTSDGASYDKYYRSSVWGVWRGNQKWALNYALRVVIPIFAKDLASFCAGEKIEPHTNIDH
jgi:hypothetical protein